MSRWLLAGLSFLCACAEEPTRLPPEPASIRSPYAAGTTILYLNFDGATITKSSKLSDATQNISFIGGGTVPAFFVGDTAKRNQVASLVAGLFASFNLKVVTTRPSSGDYQMVLIGGKPSSLGIAGAFPAISPMDCGNANPRDICFVFAEHMATSSTTMLPERISQTTGHEAGHGFGLPHSGDGCDLMVSPFDSPCASFLRGFLDKQMSAPDGSCGMSATNSYQLLLTALGPAGSTPPAKDLGAAKKDLGAAKKDLGAAKKDLGAKKDAGTPTPIADASMPPPGSASFGAACSGHGDCASGLCALAAGGQRYCTELCDLGGAPCPGEVPCLPVDPNRAVCGLPAGAAPDDGESAAGGCVVAARAGEPSAGGWLVLLLLLGGLRRRRAQG